MKNSDKPAYPLNQKTIEEIESGYWFDLGLGMTKRERFAMAAMQGIIRNLPINELEESPERLTQVVSILSVKQADALLKELEK